MRFKRDGAKGIGGERFWWSKGGKSKKKSFSYVSNPVFHTFFIFQDTLVGLFDFKKGWVACWNGTELSFTVFHFYTRCSVSCEET